MDNSNKWKLSDEEIRKGKELLLNLSSENLFVDFLINKYKHLSKDDAKELHRLYTLKGYKQIPKNTSCPSLVDYCITTNHYPELCKLMGTDRSNVMELTYNRENYQKILDGFPLITNSEFVLVHLKNENMHRWLRLKYLIPDFSKITIMQANTIFLKYCNVKATIPRFADYEFPHVFVDDILEKPYKNIHELSRELAKHNYSINNIIGPLPDLFKSNITPIDDEEITRSINRPISLTTVASFPGERFTKYTSLQNMQMHPETMGANAVLFAELQSKMESLMDNDNVSIDRYKYLNLLLNECIFNQSTQFYTDKISGEFVACLHVSYILQHQDIIKSCGIVSNGLTLCKFCGEIIKTYDFDFKDFKSGITLIKLNESFLNEMDDEFNDGITNFVKWYYSYILPDTLQAMVNLRELTDEFKNFCPPSLSSIINAPIDKKFIKKVVGDINQVTNIFKQKYNAVLTTANLNEFREMIQKDIIIRICGLRTVLARLEILIPLTTSMIAYNEYRQLLIKKLFSKINHIERYLSKVYGVKKISLFDFIGQSYFEKNNITFEEYKMQIVPYNETSGLSFNMNIVMPFNIKIPNVEIYSFSKLQEYINIFATRFVTKEEQVRTYVRPIKSNFGVGMRYMPQKTYRITSATNLPVNYCMAPFVMNSETKLLWAQETAFNFEILPRIVRLYPDSFPDFDEIIAKNAKFKKFKENALNWKEHLFAGNIHYYFEAPFLVDERTAKYYTYWNDKVTYSGDTPEVQQQTINEGIQLVSDIIAEELNLKNYEVQRYVIMMMQLTSFVSLLGKFVVKLTIEKNIPPSHPDINNIPKLIHSPNLVDQIRSATNIFYAVNELAVKYDMQQYIINLLDSQLKLMRNMSFAIYRLEQEERDGAENKDPAYYDEMVAEFDDLNALSKPIEETDVHIDETLEIEEQVDDDHGDIDLLEYDDDDDDDNDNENDDDDEEEIQDEERQDDDDNDMYAYNMAHYS